MLYLIKSWGEGGKEYLKVGYTKDWTSREKAYLTHTPEFELLGIREGSMELEAWFRSNFSKYLYRNEWFVFSQEIVDKFLDKSPINSREITLRGEEIDSYLRILLNDFLLPSSKQWIKLGDKYWEQIYKESLEKNSGVDYGESVEIYKNLIYNSFRDGQEIIERWIDSLNPRELLLCDPSIDCLSIDISMDLAQILGRQRLEENPWKNTAEFYYRTTCDYKKMTEEDFQRIIKEKELATNDLIDAYNSAPNHTKKTLVKKFLYITKSLKYRDDYLAVNKSESGDLIPHLNNLVKINDQRSFDIQQVDYKDRFSVFCSIKNQFNSIGIEGDILYRFFLEYDRLTTYIDKIKLITNYILDNPSLKEVVVNNLADSDKIKQQLITVGPERIKSLGYNLTRINKDMGIVIFNREELDLVIYKEFLVGQRYAKKYIKEKLGEIYKACDFNGTPKANHLENWFEIKDMKVTIDGKQQAGFEIIKRK